MESVLQYLVNPFGVAVVAIIFGCLAGICSSIATAWQRVRRAEIEATLKHRMLEQGMSADDIKKVLESGRTGSRASKEE
jgi:hypothetical protein